MVGHSPLFRLFLEKSLSQLERTLLGTQLNNRGLEKKTNIHMPNLDLITEFEELNLNDFDYALKSHPAHEIMKMEHLNIFNDLIGRM